ncbi:tetratricopeptide repeat protein [Pseudomonas sp. HK3]|jgi:lipopolysaccharide biosynthesis regulator YciM
MFRLIFIIILLSSHLASAASISPRTYNKLNEIQQQITALPDSEKAKELNETLTELADDLSGNSLGLALTYQTHAQLKTYEAKEGDAQTLLIKALELPNLKADTASQLRSLLAYSYFNQGDYRAAIKNLKIIIEEAETSSASVYALLAASYYSIEDIKNGLPHIEKACELTTKPKEAWLQMAFSGSYQTKQLEKAISYVNQLVYNYPDKKDYWQQKAGIHQIIEDYEKAAATKELTYKKGFVEKESDFINLGQLLASQGEAFKVATALTQAIESKLIEPSEKVLNLLFQSWLQSKEINKARVVLSQLYQTFKGVDDGYQLLQYYIDAEAWVKADNLAQQLLVQTLTEKQKGKVLLYQGMVKYRLGDAREALKILGKSSAFESSSSQAKSWMSYIKQTSA